MWVGYRSGLLAALAFAGAWIAPLSALASDTALPFLNFPVAGAGTEPLGWSANANFYGRGLTTSTIDPNTSAVVNLNGGLGLLEYRMPWLSVALIGNLGQGHISYQQMFQDTYESSQAGGVRARAYWGPLAFTVGGSLGRDEFLTNLQNGSNNWDASENEIHATLSGRFHFGSGPIWVAPLVGYRYLDLDQDAHLIGSSIIAEENDISRLFFTGAKLELEFVDQLNNIMRPWAFGGYTHEFGSQAPMGPSVFFDQQMAGNQFTLFPQGTAGVPAPFPSPNTEVAGLGLDVVIGKAVTIEGAYYREYNDYYTAWNYKGGVRVSW
jgi:hypothetical protein